MRKGGGSSTIIGQEGADVLTAYSRVTVVTDQRTVDLALPSALPLADVMPQVMRYAAPERSDGPPTSWTLARVGGPTMPLVQTLQDAGVLDGEVLELRSTRDDASPALVEDVRDAVEDSVDAAGGVWVPRTTASFAVLATSALLLAWAALALLAPVAPADREVDLLAGVVPAVVAVAVLLFATWWASVNARPADAQVAAVVALVWGLLLGRSIADPLSVQLVILTAVAMMAAMAGAARLLTADATAHAAFAVVALAAVLVEAGVTIGLAIDPIQAVRVLPVLGLLTVGVLPRISLSVGGLASADYRVRHVGQLDLAALRRRYRASNDILIGALLGIAGVVVVACVVLVLGDDPWDRTLALVVAVAAVLRSRVFSRIQHVLPLRVAGLVVLGVALAAVVLADGDLVPFLVPVTAVLGAVALGIATVPISEISRARVKRTLNIAEFLVVVTMLVVLAGALGLYGQLGDIF
ncbi:hypothetical protein GCM10009821_28130 [Aeromicrobium halocynthiae]|uniref:EccD-like transmembrane domain-containing protein n=2 Tax=Aeromicrobium halocynthiae TaxID=560557 RepID=A0ABN2W8Q5_9ACTN